jgi:phage shock protein C
MKRLYKSQDNKIFGGILGGLGDYFNIDPVILRVITVFLCFLTGIFPLILAYIITCFIVPEKINDK